nr:hypothetical protein [Pseudomonas fluorescens]
MKNLAERAAEFWNGRIDIWINNAGFGAVGSFENTPLEAHEQVPARLCGQSAWRLCGPALFHGARWIVLWCISLVCVAM